MKINPGNAGVFYCPHGSRPAGFFSPKNSELQNLKILSSGGRWQATGIRRGSAQLHTV